MTVTFSPPGLPSVSFTFASPEKGATPQLSTNNLLPEPTAPAMGAEAIYALMAEISDAQVKSGKTKVALHGEAKKLALEEYTRALARQREAKEGGLLDKLGLDEIAKVATVAVAVAAIAVTGGSSLVVAGVLLSAGGFAVEKSKCFGDASKWVGLGMSVGGGLVTGFGVAAHAANAARAAQSAAAASQAAAAATASAGGGGFAASAAAGTVGSAAAAASAAPSTAAQTFLNVAEGASAGAQALIGAREIESAIHEHEADAARIDARQIKQEMARLDRFLDEIIEQLEDAKQGKQRASERLSEIRETEGQTLLMAAGARV